VAKLQIIATRQFSCLPGGPPDCRATQTECRLFLGIPVSSLIEAKFIRRFRITGSTRRRTSASIAPSLHGARAPRGCRDSQAASTWSGGSRAALGSVLLALPGSGRPVP
jgi:hypothetical protein